jgi:multiple sugar transport system permease protein
MTESTTLPGRAATDGAADRPLAAPAPRHGRRAARLGLHGFLLTTALIWLGPLAYALYTSLRPYADTGGSAKGYWSLPATLTLQNYATAWNDARLPHFFLNTVLLTVPALVLTLFLASLAAYGLSRSDGRLNVALLMLFTAGNLLPPQVVITPLYRMYLLTPLPTWLSPSGTAYDSYWGLLAIHVAFQMGFCVFVLSNFIRRLPDELFEAARVDGASTWRQYWQIVLPLSRPALGALATLEFAWIYNDFFWALILVQTGDNRPITSALSGLQGQYFTNNNLVAAAALLTALPTILVFFLLKRHFVSGLTLGAIKG